MKKLYVLAVLLLMTGCRVYVTPATISLADKACVNNGGILKIVVSSDSYSDVYCNNKAIFYRFDKELKNK